MRYTIPAGTYFGIPVLIHFTFPLILIAFGAEAWINGSWIDAVHAVVLIASVFVCVVLHEFGHALQVRRYGIEVRDIVLLPIGGMARAERIPEEPRQEIIVAISGPLVNFALVVLLYFVMRMRGESLDDPGFAGYMMYINLLLGLFNLVPAFPMDGGRILRGLLATRMDYLRATRVARAIGQVIAIGFVIIGFYRPEFFMLPIIAVFIFFGAMSEENMIRVRHALDEKVLGDFVDDDAPALFAADNARDAHARLPRPAPAAVVLLDSEGMVRGAVRTRVLDKAVEEGRGDNPVADLAEPNFPLLRPEMPAIEAYYFLKNRKIPFAMVGDYETVNGIVCFDRFLEKPS